MKQKKGGHNSPQQKNANPKMRDLQKLESIATARENKAANTGRGTGKKPKKTPTRRGQCGEKARKKLTSSG